VCGVVRGASFVRPEEAWRSGGNGVINHQTTREIG